MTRCTNCKKKGHNKRTCNFGMFLHNDPYEVHENEIPENELPGGWEKWGGWFGSTYYYCPEDGSWTYDIKKTEYRPCYESKEDREAAEEEYLEQMRAAQERYDELSDNARYYEDMDMEIRNPDGLPPAEARRLGLIP